MVHGRQWGVQQDIPVKITTEEEMKERHTFVKKTTPCTTPNWKIVNLEETVLNQRLSP